ncbi:hypothetical protein AAFF_G00115470 [Aldrovandia affinis]|uniref:Uncharacterized protein n=1 Tax=Aldrovandia affinis TaxID=143900 RepID=A0AAD7RSP6_9TELE|nr:hypothetical protein AAFF_G00115470 [Aldrovandia affinis]
MPAVPSATPPPRYSLPDLTGGADEHSGGLALPSSSSEKFCQVVVVHRRRLRTDASFDGRGEDKNDWWDRNHRRAGHPGEPRNSSSREGPSCGQGRCRWTKQTNGKRGEPASVSRPSVPKLLVPVQSLVCRR